MREGCIREKRFGGRRSPALILLLGAASFLRAEEPAPVADLRLAKSDGASIAVAGLPLTYSVTVANDGPDDLRGLGLADVYPLFPAVAGGFLAGSLSWSCTGSPGLLPHQQLRDGAGGVDGLAGASRLTASPDLAHLYVAASAEDAVAVFGRAPSGELAFKQVLREGDLQGERRIAGLDGAGGIAIAPDGAQVYVTGENAGSLAIFSRDPASGQLSFQRAITGADGLAGAAAVVVSGDGAHLYVAGKDDGAVVLFARDGGTGELSFVERQRDGFDGVPSGVLLGARDLLLSSNGAYLLVAAQQADALVVFSRNAASGALSFESVLRDGDPQGDVAVDGLDMVFSLAMSPDRRFLYTAALADDAVARFAWSEETGEPTYLGALKNGVAGASHLDGAAAVAVSGDGRRLFVAAANSDAHSIFARDSADGSLERIELLRHGQDGVDVLDDPRGLLEVNGVVFASAAGSGALSSWRIAPRAACGSAGALGEAPRLFDLDAGASLTFTAGGIVHPAARGDCDGDGLDLVAAIAATLPPGVLDPTLPDEAADGDDLYGRVSLAVTLTDHLVTVVAGSPVSYSATITNTTGAPSHSLGARVKSAASAGLGNLSWTCGAAAGAVCGAAAGSGPLDLPLDLPLGSSVTLQIVGVVSPAASGTLSLSLTASPGPCETDLHPADNTAIDRNGVIRVADLSISAAGPAQAEPGALVFYDLVAANSGPSDAEAQVTDLLPPALTRAVWSCTPTGGAFCPLPPTGSGNLAAAVLLPAGGELTFNLAAEIGIGATGSVPTTARIAASGAIDAVQGNNAATTTVELLEVVIFHDGFESGDTGAWQAVGLFSIEENDHVDP